MDGQATAGRRAHYAEFYGGVPGTGPVLLVHGNCQAEAVRVLLEPALPELRAVRLPPVHELARTEVGLLQRLLTRCQVLVTQPVATGYRGLPLGAAEVAALVPPSAVVVRVPVVRSSRLHPWQAIVRDPHDPSHPPPVVAYHDLRTLYAAALGLPAPVRDRTTAAGIRAVGQASTVELARREQHTDVQVSDLLASELMWTLNHPGNGLLRRLAERVLAMLGRPAQVPDPGRDLLGGVRAPLEAEVLAALGHPGPAREHWLVDGREVDPQRVWQAQLAWYSQHPQVVVAGLDRHAGTLRLLGLAAQR